MGNFVRLMAVWTSRGLSYELHSSPETLSFSVENLAVLGKHVSNQSLPYFEKYF